AGSSSWPTTSTSAAIPGTRSGNERSSADRGTGSRSRTRPPVRPLSSRRRSPVGSSGWRSAMIELNSRQREAMAEGRPVPIIDPLTQETYVLVRAEDYERLAGGPPPPLRPPNPKIPPMVLRSMEAFWRDLPGLLEKRRNRKRWAAYHGDERVV